MRNRAEQIDGIGRKSDCKYTVLSMDAFPSRFNGEVSGECIKAPTHDAKVY